MVRDFRFQMYVVMDSIFVVMGLFLEEYSNDKNVYHSISNEHYCVSILSYSCGSLVSLPDLHLYPACQVSHWSRAINDQKGTGVYFSTYA